MHLVNCYVGKALLCTFDGDDAATTAEADFARAKKGHGKTLKCDWGGKSGCKVKVDKKASRACGERHGKLFDGRYKGYWKVTGQGDNDIKEITKEKFESSDPCN